MSVESVNIITCIDECFTVFQDEKGKTLVVNKLATSCQPKTASTFSHPTLEQIIYQFSLSTIYGQSCNCDNQSKVVFIFQVDIYYEVIPTVLIEIETKH